MNNKNRERMKSHEKKNLNGLFHVTFFFGKIKYRLMLLIDTSLFCFFESRVRFRNATIIITTNIYLKKTRSGAERLKRR